MEPYIFNIQRFADGGAGDGAAGAAAPVEAVKEEREDLPQEQEAVPVQETEAPAATEEAPTEELMNEQPLSIEDRLAALEEALAKQNEQYMQREQDLALRQHFSGIEKQAEALKETFPDFDLRAELADPVFVRLTSPMVGLTVEDAYYAIHHREITEANAQAAAQMLGNSVQAGRNMPNENGSIQRGTPEGSYRPLADLSPEERKLRMDMIRSGKLRFD